MALGLAAQHGWPKRLQREAVVKKETRQPLRAKHGRIYQPLCSAKVKHVDHVGKSFYPLASYALKQKHAVIRGAVTMNSDSRSRYRSRVYRWQSPTQDAALAVLRQMW